MSGAWLDPELASWLPGAILGVAGALYGSLVGVLAPNGKGKATMLAIHVLLLIVAVCFVLFGLLAMVNGQPGAISYSFILSGGIVAVVLGVLLSMVRRLYREAGE